MFSIYKNGQGKNTRVSVAVGLGVVAAAGCWKLYQKLQGASFDVTAQTAMWIQTIIPVGVFALLAFGIFMLVNRPKPSDFMIAAEGEMKKVSWSSKQEIIASTTIVIFVVVFMAALLGFCDLCFSMLFTKILG